jgi:hypothetical protein
MVEGVEGFSLKKVLSNQEEKEAEKDIGAEVLAPKPSTPSTPLQGYLPAGSATTPSAVLTPSGLAANAARSNLISFRSGDRVYVKHELLPNGRLHQAEVTKIINCEIHFDPPLEGLQKPPKDSGAPKDSDAGKSEPVPPQWCASSNICLPEVGGEAAVVVEDVQRDGATWKRLTWRHLDGSTTTREVPPARTSWQPLDDALLRELEEAAR